MSNTLKTLILDLNEITETNRTHAKEIFLAFRTALEKGEIRAATQVNGDWHVNEWVKTGILLGFKLGVLSDFSTSNTPFFDKDTYPLKRVVLEDNIRIVPGGSAIRSGSYIAPSVVCMPPMYINVGAYIDSGTMVDSHALVGSCAQVGKNVHISAAVQLGGVIEPVGAMPVIVEDNVFLGGNCGIYEGCLIRKGAVLGAGVILTSSSRVYDVVHETILSRNEKGILEIPENAVIIPGARAVSSAFGKAHGLSIQTPLLIKYRDARTDVATVLEDTIR